MAIKFIIEWLLCSVAFAIGGREPSDTMSVIKCIVAGVLVAIAIAFVPAIPFSG